jgi:hypothetical protein
MSSNTYTGDLGAAENRIQSLTQAVSSGTSGLPGITDALRTQLYQREKTLPGLEKQNESKIQELYAADKNMAQTYGNPNSNMYIENPMQRQAIVSGQKTDIRGELGNILNLIQSRQQTMGNAIDKGMELYKMGLEAQKLELDQAEKTWSRIMEKAKFEESKKNSGTDYSAYVAALNAKAMSGITEAKPQYSPQSFGATSSQGQWTFGQQGWQPKIDPTLQALLTASAANPKVASVALGNESLFFPQDKTLSETEKYRQYISAAVAANKAGETYDAIYGDLVSQFPDKADTITSDLMNLGIYQK